MSPRRHDDSMTTTWRRCADGTTMIDRWHDDDLTTRPRRCDDGAVTVINPGSASTPTCHIMGSSPNPGLCDMSNPGLWRSSLRRRTVVASSSCRRGHAVGLSSLCRRHIVVVLPSYRRQAVGTLWSCRRLHRHIDPPWSFIIIIPLAHVFWMMLNYFQIIQLKML